MEGGEDEGEGGEGLRGGGGDEVGRVRGQGDLNEGRGGRGRGREEGVEGEATVRAMSVPERVEKWMCGVWGMWVVKR